MHSTLARIFPVVVLYRIPLQESPSYQTLLKPSCFEQFMVYDNSPEDFVVDTTTIDHRAIYIRNSQNPGLSHAYNQAAQYATQHGYSHLLIIDQDTSFPLEAHQHYTQLSIETPLAAPILFTKNSTPFSPVDVSRWTLRSVSLSPGAYSLRRYAPVNSGICVQLQSFWAAGGYDTRVYLDYADFVFSHRLSKHVSHLLLLPFVATQDFSNDTPSPHQLYHRLCHYLHSASQVPCEGIEARSRLIYQTFRHTIAISIRTKTLRPFVAYLRHFILKRKP